MFSLLSNDELILCTELPLVSFSCPRVALSDGTRKADISILSEKIKCNTIENTLLHGEQISAAGAKSLQTSSYVYHQRH